MAPITRSLVLCAGLLACPTLVSADRIVWEDHVEAGDVVIKDGDTLVLRGSNSVAGSLEVAAGGVLTIDSEADTTLTVGNIDVLGEFRIGEAHAPYTKKAIVELACGSTYLAADDRRKGVTVQGGGSIALFGAKGANSRTWTRLQDTAHAGDTCLVFDLPSGWEIGDEIVLPSTDFDPHQAEKRTITGISSSCVTIDRPLKYMHYGHITEGVDERGEVGLLSRSIVFRGCDEKLDDAPDVGGHMIFHNNFKRVQIQGVELQNFGQGDQLGRYPLHFHLCGRVPSDTLLRHNAIHDSNFRAIAIHGTQGVYVEGNVAFNITGHAVMLEDGAERDNVIRHNLIVLVKEKLTHVRLGSDAQVSLSAFYITNPVNTITDNVVAGVEGSAFWIHTRLEVKGQSYVTRTYDGIHPFKLPLGDMRRNAAHSVEVGFKVDSPDLDAFDYPQQRYSPPFTYMPDTMPVISDFTVHHSRQGAWLRMLRVVLDNWVVGDVTEGVQVLTRGDTSSQSIENYVTNSRFVGSTANRGNLVVSRWQFINYLENRSDSAVDRTENARMAITLYDGPMYVTNCTFSRWYSQRCLDVINPALGTRLFNTFAMSTSIVAKNVTFDKTDYMFHVSDREGDGGLSTSMLDADGDISGRPGATLLPDWGYYDTRQCARSFQWGLACPHRYINLDVINVDRNTDPTHFGPMIIHRIEGKDAAARLQFAGQYIPASNGWLYHPIISPGATYLMQFREQTPAHLKLVFSTSRTNDVFRIGIVYPVSAQITRVTNQDGIGLDASSLAMESKTACTGCFWFDDAQSMLWVVLKERADPSGPDAACPSQGCLSILIEASIPELGGVADPVVSTLLPALYERVDDEDWLDTRFRHEATAPDAADNVDWCEIDDPCLHTMDAGNRKMGILAYSEIPCKGVGCYSDSCRYCKLTISAAKVPFGFCPFDLGNTNTPTPQGTCDEFVSVGDIAAGIEVIEDDTCSSLGQGCINTRCRFCGTPSYAGSAYLQCSNLKTTSPPADLPQGETPSPAVSSVVGTSPPAAPLPDPPSTTDIPCLAAVPAGDRTAGIGAIEDALCELGGVGCFSPSCRYCRTSLTSQSSHLLPCSNDAIRNAVTSPSNGAARDPIDFCWHFVSSGDTSQGLTAITDTGCKNGGLGCLSSTCRFCSVNGSSESSPYMPCAAVSNIPTNQSPAIAIDQDPCRGLASSGDVAVGITAITETSCRTSGGIGCVTDSCRYCKSRTTTQSVHLKNCTELVASHLETAPESLLLESTPAHLSVVDAIDTCSHMVSLEENVAGIFGFTDLSCSKPSGDVGCFTDSCRYCRTSDAVDIFQDDGEMDAGDTVENFVLCPAYVISSSMGGKPFQDTTTLSCATSVSFGDAQSGISAFTDDTCTNAAQEGCFARSPCRYCKYRETRRSASLPVCPFLAGSPINESTPCAEVPSILGLSNVSAIRDARCNAASLNLTGCLAYTMCRLCKTNDWNGDSKTAHLPLCTRLNTSTLALSLSSGDDATAGATAPTKSSLSWSMIIQLVVATSCAVAAIAIAAHKRKQRQAPELEIVTPHHLPRLGDHAHVSVARITSDADYFLI